MTDKAELIVRLKFEIESLENGDKTLYIKMVNEKTNEKRAIGAMFTNEHFIKQKTGFNICEQRIRDMLQKLFVVDGSAHPLDGRPMIESPSLVDQIKNELIKGK